MSAFCTLRVTIRAISLMMQFFSQNYMLRDTVLLTIELDLTGLHAIDTNFVLSE